MSKNSNTLENIGDQAMKFTEGLANDLKDLNISKEVEKNISKGFSKIEEGIESLIDTVEYNSNKVFEGIKTNLKDNIEALPIPKETQKMIIKTGEEIIDKVEKFTKNTIETTKVAVAQTKTFAKECIKQGCTVLKSIFANIGKVISGITTPDKAMKTVKDTCKKASEAIGKAANKFKASFVEKVGGKKEKDGKASHVETLKNEKSSSKERSK